jgi:gliding motility-associated-like protein
MYSLTVTDFNGCTANDEAGINKAEYECYFIPTIFSPNADKNNDIFHVMAHGVKTFTMFIYDRWGNEIFATTDINDGWNGTYKGMNMNDGAYAYYIKLEYNNGSVKEIKGNITLIR